MAGRYFFFSVHLLLFCCQLAPGSVQGEREQASILYDGNLFVERRSLVTFRLLIKEVSALASPLEFKSFYKEEKTLIKMVSLL